MAVALLLLAGNLVVLAPYLRTDFAPQVWNNDYIYISLARLYREQPWSWNAHWYCGLPFTHAYLPLFPLLVATVPVASLGRAFHLVAGIAYALAPVALYWMGLVLFGRRTPALFAAAAYSLFPAPIYLLPDWNHLANGFCRAPWAFVTLIAYAEAPHVLGVALIPPAVAAAWRGRWILVSVCTAVVLLISWPGAIGVFTALCAVAIARTRSIGKVPAIVPVLAAAGAAYGLVALVITPRYFHNIVLLGRLMKYGEQTPAPWNFKTALVLLAALVMIAVALWRRVPPLPAFLLSWLALSGAPVVAFAVARNHLLPLAWRYGLEFNMALVFTAAAVGCLGRRWRSLLVVAGVALTLVAAAGFVRRVWRLQPTSIDVTRLPSYQIAKWLERNAAGSRVCTVGELNGALNIWSDVPQVVGATAQGFSNVLVIAGHKELAQGCRSAGNSGQLALLWLRALASRYVVVHGPASREHFHWYVQPEKFAALPAVWSDGSGDTIYRLPDSELREATVVDLSELRRLPPLRSTNDVSSLAAYVAWAHGKRPVRLVWLRPDRAELDADLQADEAALIKLNYDPGWKAAEASTEPDPIGFLLLRPAPGRRRTALTYQATWDVWLGCALTLGTIILLLARVRLWVVALVALVPAALVYAAGPLPRFPVAVAEAALQRIRPPLILPGGLVDRDTGAPPPFSRSRPVSIYGLDFGKVSDAVRVLASGREATLLERHANQLVVRLPDNTPAAAEITVEVNGCRGNSFLVAVHER